MERIKLRGIFEGSWAFRLYSMFGEGMGVLLLLLRF